MYYLSFKDLLLILIKSFILSIIIVGLSYLCVFDYKIGVAYCNILNIPKDLAFTIVSPGMAVEICIILFVVEIIALFFIVKTLRRNKTLDMFFDFLVLDL